MDITRNALAKFKGVGDFSEFHRSLAQPLLMCPMLTAELAHRLPGQLQIPEQTEDDSPNQAFFLQDLLLKRWFLY